EATDLSEVLDFAYIVLENRPAESDQTRLEYLVGNYSHFPSMITAHFVAGSWFPNVKQLNASLQPATYAKETLRSALEKTLTASGPLATYNVDPNLASLFTYNDSFGTAPFVVTDGTVGGGQCPAAIDLEIDGTPDVDGVYVSGATPAGS